MAVKFGAKSDPFGSRRAMLLFSVAAGVAAIGIGLLTGGLGVVYNALTMGLLRGSDASRVPAGARAAAIGAAVGLLLWLDPLLVGGRGRHRPAVAVRAAVVAVGAAGLLAVRLLAGPLSYAANAPGGLFAPLLALGALWGAIFHQVLTGLGGGAVVAVVGDSQIPFALVGMAALFTATVRAPLTGVVLIIEMSGTCVAHHSHVRRRGGRTLCGGAAEGPAHLRLVAGADAGRRDSPAGVASGS